MKLVERATEREPATAHLEIDRLSKSYGTHLALDSASLSCPAGRFTVLLGPSGSGKTTLLRCVAGIEQVSDGRITIGGDLVADRGLHVPPERRDLAMVFQDYALWPHMSAAQNVAYALRRRRLGRTETRRRSFDMLDRVGLGKLAERYPSELSGGEQQRVALARALVAAPRLLLCDEPLSNLDADLRERMRVEIATLVRESGPTVVYITHDQAEAFALADEIGVLQHGRLVQLGAPETIYAEPASPFVARFTGVGGELPVVVAGVPERGRVSVRFGDTLLRGRAPASLSDGRPARLMLRPTATRLTAATEEATLPGLVRDVAFRGRGYEHVIDLDGGTRISNVFSEQRWPRDENVRVTLDPDHCLVFADEDEQDAAS